jgi:hypothetical protein
MMTLDQAKRIKPGVVLTYDDGRHGHRGVKATVLTVTERYLIAQFEDRADTTKVELVPEWLSYLSHDSTASETVSTGS